MRGLHSNITNMSQLRRIVKAIKAFITAYRNDMSFEENSVYARSETLQAVQENDRIIKLLEKSSLTAGSLQWRLLDTFLRKCLEQKLTPGIVDLYQQDKKMIPGLNLDIKGYGDVGNGQFIQRVTVTLHNQLLGTAEIVSMIERGEMTARIEEHVEVK